MALVSNQTLRSVANALHNQFLADSKPTSINPSNLAWGDSDDENYMALGPDEYGAVLFHNPLSTGDLVMFDDPINLKRSFTLPQLLSYLNQHYAGIEETPTFSASESPAGRKCTLLTGGSETPVEEVEDNDATALASAFLTARANEWVTPL